MKLQNRISVSLTSAGGLHQVAAFTRNPYRTKRSRNVASVYALCAAFIAWSGSVTTFAEVVVSPDIAYFNGDGPGEGLSVARNGKSIFVSSPIAQDTGGTIFSSFVPQLIHKPNGNDLFQLTANLALSGDLALKNVIHLPYGFKGNNGALFGVEPDGVGISPDGTFAILAHETNQRAKHLQGFSVIDLRAGLENMTQQSYCIFDIDPTMSL